MKLTVTLPDGKFYNFNLVDEDGNIVGHLAADSYEADHVPTLKSMTKFQNATINIDGKGLKRLGRMIKEAKENP